MSDFLEAAETRLRRATKLLSLEPEMVEFLQKPAWVSQFSIPLRMDSGKLQIFSAYWVRHNDALGPGSGGVRIVPDLTVNEIRALALVMTIKHAAANNPAGGAKGGITANAKTLSKWELERLCRAYIRRMTPKGAWIDIPSTDVGTTTESIAWMLDEYEQIIGSHSPAALLDKPAVLGGRPPSIQDATGRGVFYVTLAAIQSAGLEPQSCRIAIQGLGTVGGDAAKLLVKEGCRLIAVSDSKGGVYHQKGLAPEDLLSHKKETGSVVDFPGAKTISNEELLEMDCEIMIPAALENLINEDNASRVKAKIIVEGANGPVTPSADNVLLDKGVTVVPDVIANAGGIIVSQYERSQGLYDMGWDPAYMRKRLKETILKSYEETTNVANEMSISLREAAWVNALAKVSKAMRLRGWI